MTGWCELYEIKQICCILNSIGNFGFPFYSSCFCTTWLLCISKRINTMSTMKAFYGTKTHPISILLFSYYRCCIVIVWICASLLEEGLGPKHWLLACQCQCNTCEDKEITGENTENVIFEIEPIYKTPAVLKGMQFSRSELLWPLWIMLNSLPASAQGAGRSID